MAYEELPTYKTPPLSEVTIGMQFVPFTRFRSAHIGLLWERFRKDFPVVEQAAPIVDAPGTYPPIDPTTGIPYPRTWFINLSESRLVQFQADRLYYNWRTKDSEPEYPRFPEISGRFFEVYGQMEKWAEAADLGVVEISGLTLTYTNHIQLDDAVRRVDAVRELLRDFQWSDSPKRFLPSPQNLSWSVAFSMPDNAGRLNAKISEGVRTSDGQKLFVIELSVTGQPVDKTLAGMRQWFDLAHVWAVRGFQDLTNPEVQRKKWGLIDEHTA